MIMTQRIWLGRLAANALRQSLKGTGSGSTRTCSLVPMKPINRQPQETMPMLIAVNRKPRLLFILPPKNMIMETAMALTTVPEMFAP